jgi:hypothetical protein
MVDVYRDEGHHLTIFTPITESDVLSDVPLCDDDEYVEWQTWPFDGVQPSLDWGRGVSLADYFFLYIKPIFHEIYWRPISVASQ